MTWWLVLIGFIAAGAVLLRWWWVTHPLTRCWRCRGSGRNPLSTKWRSGPCKSCGGSGKRKKEK